MNDIRSKQRIFVIGRGDKGEAIYAKIFEAESFESRDAHALLDDLGRHGETAAQDRSVLDHDHSSGRPERLLDIDLREKTGAKRCVFVIGAEYSDGTPALQFQDPPFIELSTNDPDKERFIYDFQRLAGVDDRVASFVCDLGEVRASKLASRIKRGRDDSHLRGHGNQVRIPLMLNVIDPKLGCSPWVLSDHEEHQENEGGTAQRREQDRHDRDARPEDDARFVGRKLFTHGGVHPYASTNLIVDI
jgi:hypothetical protein